MGPTTGLNSTVAYIKPDIPQPAETGGTFPRPQNKLYEIFLPVPNFTGKRKARLKHLAIYRHKPKQKKNSTRSHRSTEVEPFLGYGQEQTIGGCLAIKYGPLLPELSFDGCFPPGRGKMVHLVGHRERPRLREKTAPCAKFCPL